MPENQHGRQQRHSFIEAARRAQIVQAAIEVIAELGYAQATLEQIARRAGISRGLISYHFAGRDELIGQVVADVFAAGGVYMRPRIEAESTAADMLRAYIESNLAYMRDHPAQMAALVQIFANVNMAEGFPGIDVTVLDQGLVDLEQLLRWGQQTGEFRAFDTRVMAVAIRNVIDGIPPQIVDNPAIDLNAYAREVAALFDHATRVRRDET
jgi:TetR/AcrR family fatty acid metabolism transcriptional regulator